MELKPTRVLLGKIFTLQLVVHITCCIVPLVDFLDLT